MFFFTLSSHDDAGETKFKTDERSAFNTALARVAKPYLGRAELKQQRDHVHQERRVHRHEIFGSENDLIRLGEVFVYRPAQFGADSIVRHAFDVIGKGFQIGQLLKIN